MKLTDEIRNKYFDRPLDTNLWKASYEYTALAALKYVDNKRYKHLYHADAPDLRDDVNSVGIEVTEAIDPKRARTVGEMLKYQKCTRESDKLKCREKIYEYAEDFDKYGAVFPDRYPYHEQEEIVAAFQNKLQKIKSYRANGFKRLGLLIYMKGRIFMEGCRCFDEWLRDAQKDTLEKFDFVYILHLDGLLYYDFSTGEKKHVTIPWEDGEALLKLGRMAAEGEVADDNPIWG